MRVLKLVGLLSICFIFAFLIINGCENDKIFNANNTDKERTLKTTFAEADAIVFNVSAACANGESVDVLGSNFGNEIIDAISIVGPNGKIEQHPTGAEWNGDGWGRSISSSPNPFVVETRAYSGIKSIYGVVTGGAWTSGFEYNRGDANRFGEIYFTWYTYFNPVSAGNAGSNGPQWKMIRVNDGFPDGSRANDHPGELYLTGNWNVITNKRTRISASLYCADPRCWRAECEPNNPWCSNDHNMGIWSESEWLDDAYRWVKWEMYLKRSSLDVKNGVFWLKRDGDIIFDAPTVCTHRNMTGYVSDSGATFDTPIDYKWVIWMNYWGNCGSCTAEFFVDDIHMQFDSGIARVELSDSPIWDEQSQREIQKVTSWTDNIISIEVNYGAFELNDIVYLYVIKNDGTVSNGLEVVLHSGIGEPTQGGVDGDKRRPRQVQEPN